MWHLQQLSIYTGVGICVGLMGVLLPKVELISTRQLWPVEMQYLFTIAGVVGVGGPR